LCSPSELTPRGQVESRSPAHKSDNRVRVVWPAPPLCRPPPRRSRGRNWLGGISTARPAPNPKAVAHSQSMADQRIGRQPNAPSAGSPQSQVECRPRPRSRPWRDDRRHTTDRRPNRSRMVSLGWSLNVAQCTVMIAIATISSITTSARLKPPSLSNRPAEKRGPAADKRPSARTRRLQCPVWKNSWGTPTVLELNQAKNDRPQHILTIRQRQ